MRLSRNSAVRQGLKPLPQSESRLKTTEEFTSPLSEDFGYEAGNSFPAGMWRSALFDRP
ncbi:hypothetical protein QUB47_33740 [Microcoleus sp. AT9_B5]